MLAKRSRQANSQLAGYDGVLVTCGTDPRHIADHEVKAGKTKSHQSNIPPNAPRYVKYNACIY